VGVSFHIKDVDLFKLLANTQQPIKLYIIKVTLLAVSIGLPIAYLLGFFFPDAEVPDFEVDVHLFVTGVLFGPVIETVLMIPIIALLRKITQNIYYVSIFSAFFWGVIHSLQAPLWGVGVFTLFFLLTIAYQNWDVRSRGHALLVVTSIHALNNAVAIAIGALES
jgi:hypothetical protein